MNHNSKDSYAYQMGKDCGINGANTTNCHFSIFSTKEQTKLWELGKADGEKQREEKRK